jgi:hypothetical protein
VPEITAYIRRSPPATELSSSTREYPRWIRVSVLTLTSLAAFALAPAPALAGGGDVASTDAYIRADNALVVAARARLATSEAALVSLLQQVRRECPKVVAGSPQDEDSEALTFELVGMLTIVGFRPDARAIARFVHEVAGLRWSNPTLTRTIRAYARKLSAQSALAAPDLCGDLRAWAASGYRTLPDSTRRFNRAFFSLDVAIGLLPAKLLAPSLQPARRSVVRRTIELELELVDGEARAVETWGQIMDALGLNP